MGHEILAIQHGPAGSPRSTWRQAIMKGNAPSSFFETPLILPVIKESPIYRWCFEINTSIYRLRKGWLSLRHCMSLPCLMIGGSLPGSRFRMLKPAVSIPDPPPAVVHNPSMFTWPVVDFSRWLRFTVHPPSHMESYGFSWVLINPHSPS